MYEAFQAKKKKIKTDVTKRKWTTVPHFISRSYSTTNHYLFFFFLLIIISICVKRNYL